MSAAVGEHFGPEDVYAATLIGLLGAAEAGITTVVDWAELAPTTGPRMPRSKRTRRRAADRVRHGSP